ncbi:hypothetical protein VN12_07225 [Pirellula sp. SH-Sr6A]|uniref:hypothetical protein n=1 Tax=Pirellula sp. SH-Sr6A TaxID=1632865 RepID=UPI00078BE24A|nr:hypothetical protein [Pirellula sp. SH-Sr6A]AMV31895.1 hypothetical protein VN12_07225 [Pirellula sp. SH-Sr6A]
MEPSRNKADASQETTGSRETATALQELARLLSSSAREVEWGSWERMGERIPISLLQLIELAGARGIVDVDSLSLRIADARLCVDAPDAPILAVMGLLNAGKSSLVGSCLSEEGRRRILIGSGNREGTHRFILWLPSQWKANGVVWQFVQSRLLGAFSAGFEFLSDDPDRASEQYNDVSTRAPVHVDVHSSAPNLSSPAGSAGPAASPGPVPVSAMEIPLVAFDPGLDRLQIALMDCPDVQTGMIAGSTTVSLPAGAPAIPSGSYVQQAELTAKRRMEILTRAAPICSAFVIVLPANALHDEKVSELMQAIRARMPHTLQIAAVNRVPRRYATTEIRDEIAKLYGDRYLERVYMAYGYDGPQQRERIPNPPVFFESSQTGESFPLFFRIDSPVCPLPPGAIHDRDWFLAIGSELTSHSLLQDAVRSHVASLYHRWRDVAEKVQQWVQDASKRRDAMRRVLAEACLDFSRDPSSGGRIRLQASQKIVEQISHSLERTAPWWARPGRWTSKLAEAGKSRVQQLGEWLRLPAWIGGKTEGLLRFIRSRWNANEGARVVSAESLLRSIERLDQELVWQIDAPGRSVAGSTGDRSWLVQKLQRGIDRFQAESLIELDDLELDALTSQMWHQMPWGKKIATGLAPAAILFAPLLAVIMLPLDFGGSSVLVFASVKELLGAGVAGLGFALLSPDQMPKIAESEAAWRQMGDLVATLCDTLDLERPSEAQPISLRIGETWKSLPISSIATVLDEQNPLPDGNDGLQGAVHQVVPKSLRIHRGTFERFESLCRSLLNE